MEVSIYKLINHAVFNNFKNNNKKWRDRSKIFAAFCKTLTEFSGVEHKSGDDTLAHLFLARSKQKPWDRLSYAKFMVGEDKWFKETKIISDCCSAKEQQQEQEQEQEQEQKQKEDEEVFEVAERVAEERVADKLASQNCECGCERGVRKPEGHPRKKPRVSYTDSSYIWQCRVLKNEMEMLDAKDDKLKDDIRSTSERRTPRGSLRKRSSAQPRPILTST